MLSAETVERILATLPNRTIGLVGDLFLDRYFDIDAAWNEPSIETGLTAYQVSRVRYYPGALGTVLNNLAALGVGRIHPIAVLGDDGEGYSLRQALARMPMVEMMDLIVANDRMTPTYSKPMLKAGETTRELNRLDIKNRTATSKASIDDVLARLEACWDTFDALVVVDQVSENDCGVITAAVRDWLAKKVECDPEKFVLADSRERIGSFRNVAIKPNRDEWTRAGSLSVRTAFCTDGERGIVLRRADTKGELLVPGYPALGPTDICGAGDSCSAGIVCAMACGASEIEAAAFGNLVASITVRQIGVTGTATPSQVRARFREVVTSPR